RSEDNAGAVAPRPIPSHALPLRRATPPARVSAPVEFSNLAFPGFEEDSVIKEPFVIAVEARRAHRHRCFGRRHGEMSPVTNLGFAPTVHLSPDVKACAEADRESSPSPATLLVLSVSAGRSAA